MDIIKLAKENERRLIEYRRHFHMYPELTGKEYETLKFISRELEKYNIEYVEIENGGILITIDSEKLVKQFYLERILMLYQSKNVSLMMAVLKNLAYKFK